MFAIYLGKNLYVSENLSGELCSTYDKDGACLFFTPGEAQKYMDTHWITGGTIIPFGHNKKRRDDESEGIA